MALLSSEQLHNPDRLAQLGVDLAIRFVLAVLIFYVGRMAVHLLAKLVARAMRRARTDETLVRFLDKVLVALGVTIVTIAALAQLGIDTTSAAAVLGGAALAIGLALQNQLASFAAGVLLIVFRPIRVGEWIKAGGETGCVTEVNMFSTLLTNAENQQLHLPNSKVWGDTITNFTRNKWRRLDLTIGVAYDADLRKAKNILEELLANEPRILKNLPTAVAVKALAASSVDLSVRACVNTDDWWNVQCQLYENVKLRFDAEGIEIPYPQMDLNVRAVTPTGMVLRADAVKPLGGKS
jgi:small conductance mechanosensitive channel